MLISTAFAQAQQAPPGPDLFGMLLPFLLIFIVFYFLLIRPQQKRMKEHQAMLAAVRRGDVIVTGGGIVGTVTKVVSDDELQVEIAENTRVRVRRATVADVLSKPEPVQEKAGKGKAEAAKDKNAAKDAPKDANDNDATADGDAGDGKP